MPKINLMVKITLKIMQILSQNIGLYSRLAHTFLLASANPHLLELRLDHRQCAIHLPIIRLQWPSLKLFFLISLFIDILKKYN